MILCEKPLAMNAAGRARRWSRPSRRPSVPNMVWYNYRRVPAVTLAKQLIDEGKLGHIFHYRANFLQDWTISRRPAAGRRRPVAARRGRRRQRRHRRSARPLHRHRPLAQRRHHERHRHDRDVHQGAQAQPDRQGREGRHRRRLRLPVPLQQRLARRLFESTRYARGHKALYTFEINGENASITWDLHDLHRLQYFDHRDEGPLRGWRSIHVTDGDHPYMGNWWVPGLQIGYEHTFVHQVADFLDGLAKKTPVSPTFRDALETQKVCDAVLASAKSGQWTDVK